MATPLVSQEATTVSLAPRFAEVRPPRLAADATPMPSAAALSTAIVTRLRVEDMKQLLVAQERAAARGPPCGSACTRGPVLGIAAPSYESDRTDLFRAPNEPSCPFSA